MPAAEEEKKEKKEGEEGAAEAEVQRVADPRCGWFEEVVLKNLKIKSDKYKKLMMMPEST